MRRRLDVEMVRRRLTESPKAASALVASGRVSVGGSPALTTARLVDSAEPIAVYHEPDEFVSRGGIKLRGAFEKFEISPSGRRALDVGASAGGFTDYLLQAGATSVVSIDVGRAQIHHRIATNPRVTSMERTDVRDFAETSLERFELIVVDVSFISLTMISQSLATLAQAHADVVCLIKPEFEAPRSEVKKGGIVNDPLVWRRCIDAVEKDFADKQLDAWSECASPINGVSGNAEFFVHFKKGGCDV